MGEERKIVLELVEVVRYEGSTEKRYRFRIKGTNLYFNIPALSVEEATEKARNMIRDMQLEKILEEIERRRGGEGGSKKA